MSEFDYDPDQSGSRPPWWMQLEVNKEGKPRLHVSNVLMILSKAEEYAGLLAYDEFAHCVVILRSPPPAFKGGGSLPGPYPRQITDVDITCIQASLQHAPWCLAVGLPSVQQAIEPLALRNKIHPVRNYLSSLQWDGVPRLASWLHKAFGTPDNALHSEIGTKFLQGAVRRVMKPGCKFDTALILEGPQGCGKSQAIQRLSPSRNWVTDQLPANLADKDASQALSSKWLIEMAEMEHLVRSSSNVTKAYITRQVDYFRPPFGRSYQEQPRQCVFIGTTNETDWLNDITGGRRYWPVRVIRADLDWIDDNRDQLFAESRYLEIDEGPLNIIEPDLIKSVQRAQRARMAIDEWAPLVLEKANILWRNGSIVQSGIVMQAMGLQVRDITVSNGRRVGGILRMHGWVLKPSRRGGGLDHKLTKQWMAPVDQVGASP